MNAKSGAGTPQHTQRAVLLSVIQAVIQSAAKAYRGLFAGQTAIVQGLLQDGHCKWGTSCSKIVGAL